MKNQIIFVLALVASLMSACDDTDPVPTTIPMPVPSSDAIIRSVYPSEGAPGSTVAIFGENFGPTSSHNYVSFDAVGADITYVGYGIISVIIYTFTDIPIILGLYNIYLIITISIPFMIPPIYPKQIKTYPQLNLNIYAYITNFVSQIFIFLLELLLK